MNYEKLDNEQKELVKHWIEKFNSEIYDGYTTCYEFTKKHLTPETVIEVGKWRKSKDVTSKFMVFIESFETPDEDDNTVKSYGFSKEGDWMDSELRFHNFLKNDCIEATKEEVEQRMIEEAKKRDYRNGNYKCMYLGSMTKNVNEEEFYLSDDFCLWQGVRHNVNINNIFSDGKWAEIIDEKAEITDGILGFIARIETELQGLKSKL